MKGKNEMKPEMKCAYIMPCRAMSCYATPRHVMGFPRLEINTGRYQNTAGYRPLSLSPAARPSVCPRTWYYLERSISLTLEISNQPIFPNSIYVSGKEPRLLFLLRFIKIAEQPRLLFALFIYISSPNKRKGFVSGWVGKMRYTHTIRYGISYSRWVAYLSIG